MAAIAYGMGASVCEGNSFAGKKLLLSGSGQCNYTNNLSHDEFLARCGNAKNFLKPALFTLDPVATVRFFRENGCPSFIRDDAKVFPASKRSSDIRDSLLTVAKSIAVEFCYDTKVTGIEYDKGLFRVCSSKGEFHARQILLAGGGRSYPQTGSDGNTYHLAKALGHQVTELSPSLCGVEISDFSGFVSCSGISIRPLQIKIAGTDQRFDNPGDVLITHTGLSGPGIIDLVHSMKQGDCLELKLIENAESMLQKQRTLHSGKALLSVIKGFAIPASFAKAILQSIGLEPDHKLSDLKKEDRMRLVHKLEALPFSIRKIESWEKAMATAGGVSRQEVNAKTMESRLCPGLYFAGEILDYALPSGGFNIQIAFSTGYLAGKSAQIKSICQMAQTSDKGTE